MIKDKVYSMKNKYFILLIGFMFIVNDLVAASTQEKTATATQRKISEPTRGGEAPLLVHEQYGQDPSNTKFLEALASAYQTSTTMQGSNADQRLAAEKVADARTGYHPNISGTLSNTRGLTENNPTTRKGNSSTESAANNTFNTSQSAGITLEQNLYKGGQTMYSVNAAEEGLKGSWESFKNTEQSVLLAATQAYLDVILKRRTLEQRISSENFLKDNFKYVKALQEAGENKTISDVAEAESKYYSAVSARVKAEGDLDVAIAVYINVVGQKPDDNIENPTVPLEIVPDSVEKLQLLALEANPEIKNLQYAVRQAQENVKAARTAWAPSVDVALSAKRNLSYIQDDGPANTTSSADRRNTNYQATTSLTVPFYQKGKEYTGLRTQKENESKARITLENKRQEVIQNCRKYWDQLVSSQNQISSLHIAIKSAQVNLEGKRKAYEVGEGILLEVLQAEEQLTKARIDLIQAEKDYCEAAFQLMKLVRTLDADTLRLNVQKYTYEAYYNNVKDGVF